MDIGNAASLIEQSVAQNNAWSAQQAQRQMDFQREMSNTAFQRQVADLKAAGLNPVLAARLGGASTPSGAMGGTDTSGTSALVQLLEMAMETANNAAGAAHAAAGSAQTAIEDNSASENVWPDRWVAMKQGKGEEVKAGNVSTIGAWTAGETFGKSVQKIYEAGSKGKDGKSALVNATVTALKELPNMIKGVSEFSDANKFRLLQGMLALESSAKSLGDSVKAYANKHISFGGSNNWWK